MILLIHWAILNLFDQGGSLSRQLGLQYIPAVVTQEGDKLKIVSAAMQEGR